MKVVNKYDGKQNKKKNSKNPSLSKLATNSSYQLPAKQALFIGQKCIN